MKIEKIKEDLFDAKKECVYYKDQIKIIQEIFKIYKSMLKHFKAHLTDTNKLIDLLENKLKNDS